MAKRFRKKGAGDHNAPPRASGSKALVSGTWIALLLAAITFLVYWPSLKSGFVYDARLEILVEGFITSLSNLPAILTLKVLKMNLVLGSRPGQMLYLMLIAAFSGKEPFGYHLCSNLLHATNVALFFVLLWRLIATEITGLTRDNRLKVQLAVAAVTLIFALHPIAVESVSEVSYSSSLLVTFFTLLSLFAAMAFRPENFRSAMITGSMGTLCALAAVTSKESGVTTVALLAVYWFLFRRKEAKLPWFLFLGAASAVTAAFLAVRFLLAPPASTSYSLAPWGYLGGSFFQVFLIQPRLWVFMMGKLIWPTHFSADYTPVEHLGLPTAIALPILIAVVLLQGWLAYRSRMGALGVAIYWLGLATVSNFVPLYRPLADRFYYLPLAGVAMQLLALLLMMLEWRRGFWMAVAPLLAALLPLTFLTVIREDVFADEIALWTDTIQASPLSAMAHNNLGTNLSQRGRTNESIIHYQKALEIRPDYAEAHNNLALALFQNGQVDEAMAEFQNALKIDPSYAETHYNLGNILSQKGQLDEAMAEFQKAIDLQPNNAKAHNNLGNMLSKKGQMDAAIIQFKKALEITPDYAEAHYNFGVVLFQKGQVDEAITQFQQTLAINPNNAEAHNNLGAILLQKGQVNDAIAHLQEVVRLRPDSNAAKDTLAKIKAMAP